MQVYAIKTHIISPNESLEKILEQYLSNLQEESIVAITSKIISVCEGRLIDKSTISKEELIKSEADKILETSPNVYGMYLTIKNNMILPSAGIDESNAQDSYILYPKNIQATTIEIWKILRAKNNIKNLGVILTDSVSRIMRRGITGVALGWCGFKPLYSYVGKPDIFGRELKYSQVNLVDSIAAAAVLVMGEGDETTPIAVVKKVPRIEFVKRSPTNYEEKSMTISLEDDIYSEILQKVKWI